MQVIVPLLLSLLFSTGAFGGPLENKINQYEELQQLLQKHCLRNQNSREVKVMVNGTELNCNHLLVLATRLKTDIEGDVEDLEESCAQESQPEANQLARQTAQIARQSVCKPQSTDLQCLGSFTCSLASKIGSSIPVFGAPVRGMLSSCRGNYSAGGCLQSIAKGIFDALWGLVSSVWDIGKAGVRAIGEWTGIIRNAENSTTEKLMAAQRAGRAYVRKFVSAPIKTMRETATAIFNGVKEAAMSSYGCEQWADPRRPFVSRCVRPMSNWNCASCQQKFQVMCGIAGMAIGEIPAALLTGGVAGAARGIARAASAAVRANARVGRVNRGVAGILSKFRPPAGLSRATEVITRQTRRLTAIEQRVIARWGTLKDSALARSITRSARAADDADVKKAMGFRLRPIGFYVDAVEAAARMGFKAGDEAVASVVGSPANRQAIAAADTARIAAEVERIQSAERQTGSMTDLERSLPPEANADVASIGADDLRALAGDTVNVTDDVADVARVESATNVRLVEGAQVVPLIRRFSNNEITVERVASNLPDPTKLAEIPRPEIKVPEFNEPSIPSSNSNQQAQNRENRKAEVQSQDQKEEKEEKEERTAREGNGNNSGGRNTQIETQLEGPAPTVALAREEIITPELLRAANFTETERIAEAGRIVGKELTPEQAEAVMRAHRVGEGTGRGFHTYTPEEIREKGLILRQANFKAEEIRALVDRGITGSLPASQAQRYANAIPAESVRSVPTVTLDSVQAASPVPQISSAPSVPSTPARAPASTFQNVEIGEARSSVVRAGDLRSSLARLAPGEQQTTRLREMRDQFRRGADGYAAEAQRKGSAQHVGQSMWLYAKAGDSTAAVQMAQLGVRQYRMNAAQIVKGIDKELDFMRRDLAANPNNPGLIIERDTLVEVRRSLVVQQTTPAPVVSAPTTTVTPAVATRPAAPPPTARTPSSVPISEAAGIANTLRLEGKSTDASHMYLRASLNDMIKEARRTKGYNEGSNYFANRNLSSAFDESLKGDGAVARQMVDSLSIEGQGAGINEFIMEMHNKNIYQQVSPAARLNMHRLIDHILQVHRMKLYTPQMNAIRSWKSYNPLQ
jgi:hypothetical protein